MGDFTLMFLGSGDAFGSGGRFQTCMLGIAGSTRFLIDCGTSALIALKARKIDPAAIDIVLITHLHGDHFGGLPFYLIDARFISKRTTPLMLVGPPGLESRLRAAMEVFFPGSSASLDAIAVQISEWESGCTQKLGPLTVTPRLVAHESGAPPFGLRIEYGDKLLAYSGDSEWTPALLDVASGADLFICESCFYDRKIKGHLDYQTLLVHRDEFDCKRLILTHFSDEMLDRLPELENEYAEDGLHVTI